MRAFLIEAAEFVACGVAGSAIGTGFLWALSRWG